MEWVAGTESRIDDLFYTRERLWVSQLPSRAHVRAKHACVIQAGCTFTRRLPHNLEPAASTSRLRTTVHPGASPSTKKSMHVHAHGHDHAAGHSHPSQEMTR